MKFDFCIGNPPYNNEFSDEGNKTYAPPVYNDFLDAANTIADRVEMIHPARFLFNAGSTPKAWNEKMLHDPHFKVLHYEEDATKVFNNTEIKGGIAITYHDITKEFGEICIFTKFSELNAVLIKVSKSMIGNLSDIIFTQNRFNLDCLYEDYPDERKHIGSEGKDKRFRNNIFEKISVFTDSPTQKDDIATLGVVKNKRVTKYICRKYVENENTNLSKWKTLVSRANGSGKFGDIITAPVVLEPFKAYTQTFIGVGSFDTKEEADNTAKYLKSKFSRAMLGVLKVTQDNDREVWRMVPLQDFSDKSDIDWSKSIKEIDQQLYKKYDLSDEEIDFIETHVKEMN